MTKGALDTGDSAASPPTGFADHFAVTATHGRTQIRFVGTSVAACEEWAAKEAEQGHPVSHVWRFDGDNVFSLEDARTQEKGA